MHSETRPRGVEVFLLARRLVMVFVAALLSATAQADPAPASEVSSSKPSSLDTVVVTARRRAEDAQQVPAALTVIDADTLTRTYTVNPGQLTQLVPTLNYSSPNPRNTAYTIRGLGSSVVAISQANDGLEPGAGFYVDQVYHARPATAAFDFTDLQQIEVLRGPQGTVFGKNTTAGAINIATQAPSFEFGGDGEVSAGELGFLQARGAVTGPLVEERAAFRLSGAITRRDGTIRNVRYAKRQNDVGNDALRGQLLLTPVEGVSVRLIGDWSRFKSECCTQVYVRVAPTLKPAAQQYATLAAGAVPGGYVPPSLNPADRLTDIDADLGVNTSEGGAAAIVDWTSSRLAWTSVTAWRVWSWNAANDRDYTGIPIQLTQRIPSRQNQYSQELRVTNRQPGAVDYVAGLYFFNQAIVGRPISIYGPTATYWLLPAGRPANLLDGYRTDGRTRFDTNSYAAFGEATWHVTPRLAATAGVRYTYEDKQGTYDVRAFGGLTTGLTPALINDRNSILRSQTYDGRLNDGSASGRASLAWQWSETGTAYASLARGEKSGGINMSGLPVYPAGVPGRTSGDPILSTITVRPERNTTAEVGVKQVAFDGALRYSAAAFYTRVRDFQANVVDNAAVVALRSYLANIPKVTVKGVELDAAARLGSHVVVRAAGAYSNGRYADYANGPCPIELTGTATARCDLTGKALPGLPTWSGSLGTELTFPAPRGALFFTADLSARSRVYGDATGSAYTRIAGYGLLNASLGYRHDDGWDVALFARNALDRDYLQNVTVQAGNSGLIVGTPGDPRLVGVTFRLRRL
jgi:iron complex outermembrane receptor protein